MMFGFRDFRRYCLCAGALVVLGYADVVIAEHVANDGSVLDCSNNEEGIATIHHEYLFASESVSEVRLYAVSLYIDTEPLMVFQPLVGVGLIAHANDSGRMDGLNLCTVEKTDALSLLLQHQCDRESGGLPDGGPQAVFTVNTIHRPMGEEPMVHLSFWSP